MALALIVLVLLALGVLALVVYTRGRIVIVWGDLRPGSDDVSIPTLRVSHPPPSLAAPTLWEAELQRRLWQRLASFSPALPPARRAPPLEATPLADGCYRLSPVARGDPVGSRVFDLPPPALPKE